MRCVKCGAKKTAGEEVCPKCKQINKMSDVIFLILSVLASAITICYIKLPLMSCYGMNNKINLEGVMEQLNNLLEMYEIAAELGASTDGAMVIMLMIMALSATFLLWWVGIICTVLSLLALLIGKRGNAIAKLTGKSSTASQIAIWVVLLVMVYMDVKMYDLVEELVYLPTIEIVLLFVLNCFNKHMFLPRLRAVNYKKDPNQQMKTCKNCGNRYMFGTTCPNCGSGEIE